MLNRRLRFSLRALMLIVLLVGFWMAHQVNRARAQREAATAVKAFGGWVHYDYEFVNSPIAVAPGNEIWGPPWGKWTPGRSPWAPLWLRRIFGDEYFQEIVHASLFVDIAGNMAHSDTWNKGPADAVLEKLESQSGIRTFHIGGQAATDAGMQHLPGITGLEELIVWPALHLTDASLAPLASLKHLKSVMISGQPAKWTDASLQPIARIPNLERLCFSGNRFTDEGLKALEGATKLKILRLSANENEITDTGLVSLSRLKKLEYLELDAKSVTEQGLDALKGLTNLRELHLGGATLSKEARARFRAAMPGLAKFD